MTGVGTKSLRFNLLLLQRKDDFMNWHWHWYLHDIWREGAYWVIPPDQFWIQMSHLTSFGTTTECILMPNLYELCNIMQLVVFWPSDIANLPCNVVYLFLLDLAMRNWNCPFVPKPWQISQWLVGDVGASRLQAYPPKHNHLSRTVKRCPPWN